MDEDGQRLIDYASGGDVSALSELVARHSAWLAAYLRSLTESETEAEDALQDLWLRVIRHCESYRGGSIRAYLARIARSTAIDRFRRRERARLSLDAESADGGTLSETIADAAPTPSEAFGTRATSSEIRQAVRSLPDEQREVLMLRIEGELTFQEISNLLGIPLGTALTRMRTATQRLKRLLEDKQ